MARLRSFIAILALVCATSFIDVADSAGLVNNYYAKSCPGAEKTIRDSIYRMYEKKGNIATSFIRFGFHDFFNGADGSFWLLSAPGKTSEKDSHSMAGMRNEKYVNTIKDEVEKVCPGIVSCADILAVGSAAAVQVLGGPYIHVKTGRRDTRNSLKSSADTIPHPQDSVTKVLAFYNKIGINPEQAVALMGAHTIGRAHCTSFNERLYPTIDPKMDAAFAAKVKRRCPANPTSVHFTYFRNDEPSPMAFDNNYFKNLVTKQGLMGIDSALYWDQRTQKFVINFSKNEAAWRKVFTVAYQKLSEYKPLTGTQGEIRKRCMYVN